MVLVAEATRFLVGGIQSTKPVGAAKLAIASDGTFGGATENSGKRYFVMAWILLPNIKTRFLSKLISTFEMDMQLSVNFLCWAVVSISVGQDYSVGRVVPINKTESHVSLINRSP